MDIKNDDQFEDDDFSGFNSGDIDSDFLADEYAPKDANNETIEPIQKVERNEQNKSLLNFGSTLQIGDESPLSGFPQAQQSQKTTKNDAKINNTPIDLKSFLQTPVGSIADLDDKSNVTGSRLLIKKTMDKAQDKPKPKVNIFPIPLNDSSSLHFESSSQLQISSKDNNNSSNNSNLINNSTKTSQFTLPGIPVLTNDQNNLPPLSDKNNINLKPQSNVKIIKVSASNATNSTIPSDNHISINNHDASKTNEEVKNANITIPSQNKTENSTIKVSIKPRFAVNQKPDLQSKQKLQQQTNQQQIQPLQQQQTMQQNQSSVKQIQDQPSQQQPTSNQQDQQKHVQVVYQPLQNQQQQTVQQTPSQHQILNQQQQQLQNQQTQNHQPQQNPQQQVPNQNDLQNHVQPQQQKIKSQQMAEPQSQQQIQETPKQQENLASQPQQMQSQQISSQNLQNQQHQIQPPQQQNLQQPQQSQIQPQQFQFQAQPQQQQQQQAFASPPLNSVTQVQQQQLQPHPALSTPPPIGLTQMPSQSSAITHTSFVPQSSQQPPQPQVRLNPQPQQQQPQPVPLLLQPNPIIYNFSTPPSVPLVSQYSQSTERVHLSFSAALDSSLATVRRSVATELTTALRNSSTSRFTSSFSSHSFTLDVDDFLSGLTSELVNAISFTAPVDTSSSSQPPLLPPSTSLYTTPLNQFHGGNINSADFDYSNGFSSVNVNIGSAMPSRVNSTASAALFDNNGNQAFQKEPILMRQLVRGIGAAIDNETRPLSVMMKNAMQEKNRAKMENVTILQNLLNDIESMRMTCKNFSDEIIRELEREELMVSSRKEAAISESNKKASQLREMKLQSIEFESKKSQQEIELKKNSELFDRLKQQKIDFISKSSGKFSLNDQSGRLRRDMQNRLNNSVNGYEFEQVLDEINEIENEIENGGYGQICGEFESLLKCFQNDTNSMRDEILNEDYFNQQFLSMSKLNSRNNGVNNNSYYSQNRMQVPSQQNQNFNSNLNSYTNNNMSMSKQSQGNLISGKNHSNFQNKIADTNKRISSYRSQRDALMQSNLT